MSSSNHIVFDETALEALFKEQFKSLCVYCQSRFGFEIDEAKEVVHTSFIKLWEMRESISPDLSIKAYLFKMAGNLSLDMIRHEKVKQRHAKLVSQTSSANTRGQDYNDSELKQMIGDIDRAVAELPEQMRKVFELSRYGGLKYGEIAAQLSISLKTVETQMSRALEKLRVALSEYLLITLLSWFLI